MTRSLLQSLCAILAGFIVAMFLVTAVEVVCGIFHPFPPGVDTSDIEVCKAHVAKYPHWVLAIAVIGWGVTTFVSVWVATRLGAARHPAHGFVIGALLLLAAAFNMIMLPYPLWFEIVNYIVFPLAIFEAVILGRDTELRKSKVEIEATK